MALILLPHPLPDAPGEIFWFKNIFKYILTRPSVRVGVRPSCCQPDPNILCQPSMTVDLPHTPCCQLLTTKCNAGTVLFTIIVRCIDDAKV